MSKTRNKNTTIKILALFISLLLWSYVRNEENPKIIREFKGINIVYTNERILNDKGLVIMGPKEVKINVKVSGRMSDVNSMELKDIETEVDLSEVTEGTRNIPIQVRVIPFKVELEDINKKYVTLEVDSLSTVEKSVNINMVGASKGDIIKESTISPETIKVSGPSTLISKISKVVVNIDVDKMGSNDIMKLPVKVVDKKGNQIDGIKTNPDMVEVSISLLKLKQVPIKPVLIGKLEEGYTIISTNSDPKTITIKGLEKDLAKIDMIETEAIDITDFKESKNIDVNLKVPESVQINTDKKTTKISIKIGQNVTKDILVPISLINFENIKEGFKVNLDGNIEKNINVRIKGDREVVEALKPEDFKINADLTELEEGNDNIKITVLPLKNIVTEKINPEEIIIDIEPV